LSLHQPNDFAAPQTPSPALLKKTYGETLDLIVEARNYMAYKALTERRRMDRLQSLKLSCEAFRVTSRLTQVMSWLMAQRAVQDGEISLDEAIEKFRLEAEDVCLDDSGHDDDGLPEGFRSLQHRSHRLYQRISRLDRMVRDRRSLH